MRGVIISNIYLRPIPKSLVENITDIDYSIRIIPALYLIIENIVPTGLYTSTY